MSDDAKRKGADPSDADAALRAAAEAIAQLGSMASGAAPANTPDDDPMAAAMNAAAEESAMAAAAAAASARPDPAASASPLSLPSFSTSPDPVATRAMDLLGDVFLNVKIELGRTRMIVDDVLKLGEGAVIELDKLAGDPVDVYVNDRHVARGEVLVLNDNFCVRVNEILAAEEGPRAAAA
jgi:flagellar motor switch protein FliN/FliY